MNERIRELAMQTDRECEHLGQSDIGEDWVEKFAELIVRESIDGLKNAYSPDDCLPQEEITEFLKEHFGVK